MVKQHSAEQVRWIRTSFKNNQKEGQGLHAASRSQIDLKSFYYYFFFNTPLLKGKLFSLWTCIYGFSLMATLKISNMP